METFQTPKLSSVHMSLNRTMQYGNYSPHYFLNYSWICLNRTMQYGNLRLFLGLFVPTVFKSYYVVWKHIRRRVNLFYEDGLNRTMQYGNQEKEEEEKYFEMFKSYYVVWKPTYRCNTSSIWSTSLNRTMQYGNFCFSFSIRIISSV